MYPGAMLADIGDLHHIGIKPRGLRRLAEGRLVHSRRTGADDDPRQIIFFDCVFDELLTVFGTHVLIIRRKNHPGFYFHELGDPFHIYRCRDIAAAPTNKNTYSLHFI